MLTGVAGKIIESRLSEEIMKHRLQIWLETGRYECPENDPWEKEWRLLL